MDRPEERDPAVIAFAEGVARLRGELELTPWLALVGAKLAVGAILDETCAPGALLYSLRQMLDELEGDRARASTGFAERIEPYPVERWKLPRGDKSETPTPDC